MMRYVGYSAFFLFSFILGLYVTFPWDVAKDRVLELVAKNAGVEVRAKSVEPNWLTGVIAEGVEIKQLDGPPIKLDRVKARVGLFALIRGKTSFSASLPLGKGEVEADVYADDTKIDVTAKIDKVQLDQVPALGEALGVPMSGKLNVDTKIALGRKDIRSTEGHFNLKTSGFKIEKGAKLGGFPLPAALDLGDIDLQLPIKEGKGTLKNVQIKGNDVEITMDGTVNPAFPFTRATISLNLGLKPTEKLLEGEPLLRPLLKNFEVFKSPEGYFGLALMGSLLHPRMTPHKP
jgi:type II secretion system protein N